MGTSTPTNEAAAIRTIGRSPKVRDDEVCPAVSRFTAVATVLEGACRRRGRRSISDRQDS
jgi:hypothetical protein